MCKKPRSRVWRFFRRQRREETSKTTNDTPIVNLSSVDLTESENRLLSKGLGFCPRPKRYDRGNLLHDNKVFSRRMRLKSHFNDRDDTNRSSEKYPSFVPKSDWQPPNKVLIWKRLLAVWSLTASHMPLNPKCDNLMKSERSALYELQNRQKIIIKPADKGSAIVVMDRDHYISEAERQLGDSTYYRFLDHDPTLEFAKEVSEAINEMHNEGHISEKNRNYLLVDQPKAGRFYLLSKTVVLIVKINFILFVRCVDSEDKLYIFARCVNAYCLHFTYI